MKRFWSIVLCCSAVAAQTAAHAGARSGQPPRPTAGSASVAAYDDADLRAALVVMLSHEGVSLNWDRYSASRLTDCWLRCSLAKSIDSAGYGIDWTRYNLWQLAALRNVAVRHQMDNPVGGKNWRTFIKSSVAEQFCRAELAGELKQLGVTVQGRGHPAGELIDWYLRAHKAVELKSQGINVDWRRHSMAELFHWSLKQETAQILKKHNVCWQWREHTLVEMLSALGRAKQREAEPPTESPAVPAAPASTTPPSSAS